MIIYMNLNFKNNYQVIFLVILCIIIVFQIYQLFNKNDTLDEDSSSSEVETYTYHETESIQQMKPRTQKIQNSIKAIQPETNKLSKYGNAHDVFDDNGSRIMYWKFNNDPWACLYYNSTNDTMTFGINHIISNELLASWKKVIPNVGFNDKDKLLMITSTDEESALAVINLVLSTIHQELTIDEIMNSNLIDISVNKIRAHPLVKTKILEQVNEKISISKEKIEPDDGLDLATNDLNIDAYGGNEFSFL